MDEQLAPDVANFIAKKQRIAIEGNPITETFALPSREQIPQELLGVAETLKAISGTWNPVEIYTADADSIASERQKVFEAYDNGEEYNPDLTYSYANSLELSGARVSIGDLLHTVRRFAPEDRISRLFRTALYFKLKDDMATCDLVDGIKTKNEDKIATALKQKYPGTDPALLAFAEKTYDKATREGDPEDVEGNGFLTADQRAFVKGMRFDAKGIKAAFEWALSEYGILWIEEKPQGFKVKIDRNATGIDVRDKSADGPTVFIPEDREMNGKTLLGLIAHEIERHAVQSMNGQVLFEVGGGALKIDNEQLYEGLGLRGEADINKKLFGIDNSGPRPYYPLAAKMAEEGASFYKIFCDQVERRLRVAYKAPVGTDLPANIDPKKLDAAKRNAWLSTYRVMRGHTDMSNKKSYAMAKDLGYMRGFLIDQQLQEHGVGYLNESAIVASGGLQLLAELDLTEDKLPYRFKDVATKYCMEVMLPQMETAA